MDAPNNPKPIKKGTGPLGVCPYLGVQDDPATHFAWAKPGHFCYRVRPAQAIEPGHQENFCLNGRYPTCVVYPASWRGPLPANVRDDAYMDWVKRAAVIKTGIAAGGTQAQDKGEVKTTSNFGMDLSTLREQSDFVEDEPIQTPRWKKIDSRYLLTGIGLTIILLLVCLAVYLGLQSLVNTSVASNDTQSGASLTATWEALQAALPTSTPAVVAQNPTDTPIPTATAEPTATWTAIPPTETAPPSTTIDLSALLSVTLTSTPSPFTCADVQAYTPEIVDGPILVPEMGHIYSPSTSPSRVSAGWVLRNNSPCTWESILLLSLSNNRLFVPYMRLNGQLVTEDDTTQSISVPPGGEIEVGLVFPMFMASGIRGEWVLVINNLRLHDQPHLTLDVKNWVLGLEAPPTQSSGNRPPGPRNSGGDDDPPPVRP
jgi:hypothetical protein